jgi:peptidyl-prolyl cis-trans isomerase D
MISFFRRALSSWVVLGLLGLIMVAFIITGVESPSMLGGGGGGATVAKVDGQKISALELTNRVRNQIDGLRRERPEIDAQSFLASGGFEQVLSGMINARALEAWGKEQGFAISKRLVDAEIAGMQGFRNVAGQFDESVMRTVLAQARISEKELRADIAGEIMRNQILTPAAALAPVPSKMARPYAALLLEVREGSVGIIPLALVASKTPPSDADVAAAYKANIATYTRPEARVLRYATFGEAQLADRAKPTEQDIADYYRDNADSFAARETRTIVQIIAPTQRAAQTIAASVKGGATMAAAAAKAGLEASTIADQQKKDFTESAGAAAADLAFAAAKGAVVGPVKGSFGWYVLKIEGVAGKPGKTLDQARAEILPVVQRQKMQEALSDLAGKIEDAIADGSSFAEIAAANKLVVRETPALLSNGTAIDQPGWKAPPEIMALLKTGFEAAADDRPSVETVIRDQSYALLNVAKIIPPTPLPLAQVREAVVRDLVVKRAQQRAKAIGDKIVAAVNAGTPLAKAVADSGVALPPVQPSRARQLDIIRAQQAGQPIPEPLRAMFALQPGKARLVPGDQGAYFVTVLNKVARGDLSQAAALVGVTQQELTRSYTPELGDQLIRAVRDEVDVKRYPDAIAATKRQIATPQ